MKDFHPDHLADLRKSGLSDETIEAAGIRTTPPRDIPRLLKFPPKYLISAYQIPYPGTDYLRFRCFYEAGRNGRKYLQPSNSQVRLYIPPGIEGALQDPTGTLWITEGEKKALKAIQEGLCCIGLGGLWNWKGKGKLLPEFNSIPLDGRHVRIIPDNDFRRRQVGYENNDLVSAVQGLSKALTKLGAKVKVVLLPKSPEKVGLDDFLLTHAPEDLDALETIDATNLGENTSAIIEMFNEKHAVVMVGGKCTILTETICPVFNRPDITFSSVGDFRNFYAPMKIQVSDGNGGMKSVSAARRWLDDPNRRQYEGVVFAPQKDVPGYYNLWRGFAVEPRPGDWTLLRSHVMTDFCHGNSEYFDYLMGICADAVQNPGGQRPGVSIVLRGAKGTGKGLFATSMGQIFGSHFLHLSNSHHLTGRFNAHLKDALWVFADEAFWAGDKSSEGILKHLITEEYWTVEQKGKDPYTVKNHVRLIISSNETWVVPAGLQERRFFVLDVDDAHARDTKFFGPIFSQMRNGGIEAMLHDLLRWDVTGLDLRTAPMTEALFEQAIQGMNTVQRWWYERLRSGAQLCGGDRWDLNVETQKLHEDYIQFATTHGDRFPVADAIFSRELGKLVPDLRRCRLSLSGVRKQHVTFPDLEMCRGAFADKGGCGCRWDKEEA